MLYTTLGWGTHSALVWRLTPCGTQLFTSSKCDHLSENPRSSHKYVYWNKMKFKIIFEITHATGKYLQGLMGSEGSFKSTKTIYHLTCLAIESLFRFCSLNGDCVTWVCLLCSRCKQTRYHFLGKTTTIDKCAVSLRAIPIDYLFGQSLVNIIS